MGFKYSSAGKTDIGLVRSGNEDNFRIIEDNNLFIVCDGMGGHQAGEVASKEACDIIGLAFSNLAEEITSDSALKFPAAFPPGGDLLVKAIRLANRSIFTKSKNDPQLSGMGTTVVAAVLENNMISIAHVGDSRAYKMVGDRLMRLTTDHSWVEELQKTGMYTEAEANKMAGKNVITRALGVHETVEVDFRTDAVTAGEIYIFCSDGLCGFVEDETISDIAIESNGHVNKICSNLVAAANERGGQDNVTVVAFKIDQVDGEPGHEVISPVTISKESDETLLRENEIVAAIEETKKKVDEILVRENGKSGGALSLILVVAAIIVILVLIYYSVIK
ncbi:MAG: Stp1/IreP family PP2C-type Ser/Thr phosphatase [Candidatus Zixiibacteriota bacterium]